MSCHQGPTPVARFQPGAKVRVKTGIRDPDYPDIPLGGWSGTIKEVQQFQGTITYLIAWDERTLGQIHPVYRKRCERDGLEFETTGLGGEDIEPDEGTPMAIERPTQIVTKPLSAKDQEDRIRMVFGLTHDDLLPEVNHETLLAYHRYLSEHLKLPFQGRYDKRMGWSRRVKMPLTVTGLLRPDECEIAAEFGIIGTGRDAEEKVDFPLSEVDDIRDRHNRRLIADYSHWIVNVGLRTTIFGPARTDPSTVDERLAWWARQEERAQTSQKTIGPGRTTMQLDPDDCLRFYKLHQALMSFVNQRCKVIKKPVASPEQFAKQPPEERLKVREALLNQMDLIDAFVAENPFASPEGDLDIIRSWKDLVAGKFIVFRYLKKHTIFLTMKEPVIAYGVLALSDPFEDLIGPYLPVMCETVLLPFEGRIIYDGLMTGYNVSFGGGYRRSFQESYNQAKERFGIVTHLPFVPETAKKREEIPRPKKRVARSKSPLLGRWRITWMEQWDQDFVDAEVEGYFEFGPRGSGKFQFGYVQGGIDYRVVERDGKPAVEFSWDGNDEMDPAQGRGWAVRDGDEIEGMIFIHRGDESQFRAKRMK